MVDLPPANLGFEFQIVIILLLYECVNVVYGVTHENRWFDLKTFGRMNGNSSWIHQTIS